MNKPDKKKSDAEAQQDDIRRRQDQECVQLLQDMDQLRREMEDIDSMLLALRGEPDEADLL